MLTIYKFPYQENMKMPEHCEILDLQVEGGKVASIWAIVDTEAPLVDRKFYTFGTGQELFSNIGDFTHIKTIQQGQFVWHIFEEQGYAAYKGETLC